MSRGTASHRRQLPRRPACHVSGDHGHSSSSRGGDATPGVHDQPGALNLRLRDGTGVRLREAQPGDGAGDGRQVDGVVRRWDSPRSRSGRPRPRPVQRGRRRRASATLCTAARQPCGSPARNGSRSRRRQGRPSRRRPRRAMGCPGRRPPAPRWAGRRRRTAARPRRRRRTRSAAGNGPGRQCGHLGRRSPGSTTFCSGRPKGKARRSHSLPLLTYRGLGGLPQDPGRAAESSGRTENGRRHARAARLRGAAGRPVRGKATDDENLPDTRFD